MLLNKLVGYSELPTAVEGNTSENLQNYSRLFDYVSYLKPKSILEVGFNAGHSACCFLNASPNSSLVSFDICRHGSEEPAYNILKKYFDIELIKGDSKVSIPEWSLTNSKKFDFIFIDGGHDYDTCSKDISNCLPLLSKGGTIVVDDGWIDTVITAVKNTVPESYSHSYLFKNSYQFIRIIKESFI